MIRKRALWSILSLLFSTGALSIDCDTAKAAEETDEVSAESCRSSDGERAVDTYRYADAELGYRFITPGEDGGPRSIGLYERLKSGMAGRFSLGTVGSEFKLTTNGTVLHGDDYHVGLALDYGGYVRVSAESEALWHTLQSELLPTGLPSFGTLQSDQNTTYGVKSGFTQVETRLKLGNNPVHINASYREYIKEGTEQTRFSAYLATSPESNRENTLIALGRDVDRKTREGSIGFDAHLGVVDLSYGFRIRDFTNQADDSRYTFDATTNGSLLAGTQAYNVIPDSRVTSHTLKLFTDMSGGLVGTVAYTLTNRVNEGGHGDVAPSRRPEDTLHLLSGDLTYTPLREVSFALKYRHLEILRDSPQTIYYSSAGIPTNPTLSNTSQAGLLNVRPSTDTTRDTLSLSSSLRPGNNATFRLEYRLELESRDHLREEQSAASDPTALYDDSRTTHTGTAALSWRPYPGLRLNTSYAYASCNNPTWPAAFSERHKGEMLLTYTKNGIWGASTSYLVTHDTGEHTAATTGSTTQIVTPSVIGSYVMPREVFNNTVTAGLWVIPVEHLTLSLSYSFLQLDTDQTMLLSSLSNGSLVATNYRSMAHVYGLTLTYAPTPALDCSLALQQTKSSARFDAGSGSFTICDTSGSNCTLYTTAGITDPSRLSTTESSVAFRTGWQFAPHVGCSLEYTFRHFDSNDAYYDGSVHTTLASLKATW